MSLAILGGDDCPCGNASRSDFSERPLRCQKRWMGSFAFERRRRRQTGPRIGLPMAKSKHPGTKAERRDGRARERSVPRRTVVIARRPTSVSLEDAFWDGVKEIAAAKGVPATKFVAMINRRHQAANLSSAIRLFVLNHCRRR